MVHHRPWLPVAWVACAGDGLLTSEEDVHVRQRRLVQPAFSRQHLPQYGAAMVGCAARLRHRWQDGATLNLDQEMTRLTLPWVEHFHQANIHGPQTVDIRRVRQCSTAR
jgi:cytochrome P450